MKIASFLTGICAIMIGLNVISFARAEVVKREVKANKSTGIYGFYQYNPNNCGSMAPPKFKIKSVEHGKIGGGIHKFKIEKGRCKGRQVKGVGFVYKPKRGFRGLDKARVILSMPNFTDDTGHASRTLDFRIKVK